MDNDLNKDAILRVCDELPLAMAYVPSQRWGAVYELDEGFDRGTVFPCLDKPFLGGGK